MLGRAGEKPKSKALAVPKGTMHNPTPTGPGWMMAALELDSSHGEMQRQTSAVSLRVMRVSSRRGSITFEADCEGKQNKNLIH